MRQQQLAGSLLSNQCTYLPSHHSIFHLNPFHPSLLPPRIKKTTRSKTIKKSKEQSQSLSQWPPFRTELDGHQYHLFSLPDADARFTLFPHSIIWNWSTFFFSLLLLLHFIKGGEILYVVHRISYNPIFGFRILDFLCSAFVQLAVS